MFIRHGTTVMYLERIHIRNFRNFSDFTMELKAGLNVIVGENNIGKTNLLEALRAAIGSASTGEPTRLSGDDLNRDQPEGTPMGVDLRFADLSADEKADFIDLLDYNPANPKLSTASLHCEWAWDGVNKRWITRRWGGERPDAEAGIPEDVLQNLPITTLVALRDALAALQPGRQSRLGRLLRSLAGEDQARKSTLEQIIREANKKLQADELVRDAEKGIQKVLEEASGTELEQEASIRAAVPQFERIVNSLRLVLAGTDPSKGEDEIDVDVEELWYNGLGYNNILYIATILTELQAVKVPAFPLLLVEEPEAHLHPQLQTRLADYLNASPGSAGRSVQTIVTTHSPTVAAHVPIDAVNVLHWSASHELKSARIGGFGLTETDEIQLERLLDVTKASMLFAKGIIIVEGVSEALLLPVLARRLKLALEDAAVSVIPLWGVEFQTILKLFGADRISIPTAFVSDSDPEIENKDIWRQATPTIGGCSSRMENLATACERNTVVKVCRSKVTLEYDLAAEHRANPILMASIWEKCFAGQPQNLNPTVLKGIPEGQRALHVWRVICRADPDRKGIFAHRLATALDRRRADGSFAVDQFHVPLYLKEAVEHATQKRTP